MHLAALYSCQSKWYSKLVAALGAEQRHQRRGRLKDLQNDQISENGDILLVVNFSEIFPTTAIIFFLQVIA
jgi:hypothetical protein